MKTLLKRIRLLLKNKRIRLFWTRFVSGVAAFVVFVTTYALVLPAITMELDANCGIEAHQHTDDCYEERLICTIPEGPGHHHDDSCYRHWQEQVCTLEEHTHDETCPRDEDGNLICEIPEHVHDESCFEDRSELTCTLEESDGHQHDALCYERVLICSLPEHIHSEECYSSPDEEEEEIVEIEGVESMVDSAGSVGAGTPGDEDFNLYDDGAADDAYDDSGSGDTGDDAWADDNNGAADDAGNAWADDGSGAGDADISDDGSGDAWADDGSGAGDAEISDNDSGDVWADDGTGAVDADISDDGSGDAWADDGTGAVDADISDDSPGDASADGSDGFEYENSSEETDTSNGVSVEEGFIEEGNSEEGAAADTFSEEEYSEDGSADGTDPVDEGMSADTLTDLDNEDDNDPAADTAADDPDADLSGTGDSASENAAADGTEAVTLPADGSAESDPEKTTDPETTDPENTNADEEARVSALEPLDFASILNSRTAVYYHHVEEGESIEDSSLISDWKKVDKNTELGPNDLIRVYLSYTIPAGSLNETNQTSVYQLPANLHLTDAQVKSINAIENGIAASYIDYNTLTLLDPDNYHKYLGAEAVEGTRIPGQDLEDYLKKLAADGEDAQEFISAAVRVEDLYDTEGLHGEKDAYLGQGLLFTFSPYTIEKNRKTLDAAGQTVKTGETVSGWFSLDFNLTQVDWAENEYLYREAPDSGNSAAVEADSDGSAGENADPEAAGEEAEPAAAGGDADPDGVNGGEADIKEADPEAPAVPAAEESAREEAVSGDSAAEAPASEEAVSGDSAAEAPASEGPVSGDSAAEAPVSEGSVGQEAVSEDSDAEEIANAAAEEALHAEENNVNNIEENTNHEPVLEAIVWTTDILFRAGGIDRNVEEYDEIRTSLRMIEPVEQDELDLQDEKNEKDMQEGSGEPEELQEEAPAPAEDSDIEADDGNSDDENLGDEAQDEDEQDLTEENKEDQEAEESTEKTADSGDRKGNIFYLDDPDAEKDADDKSSAGDQRTDEDADKEKEDSAKDDLSEKIMPAMSFEDSIRVSTGKPAGVQDGSAGTAAANAAEALPKKAKVTVRVEADEGTFPVGTTMVLSAVEDMDAVAETVKEAVENANPASESGGSADNDKQSASDNKGSSASNSNQKTYGFQAVDISFRDKDGKEIEPAKPVRVALTSSIVEQVKKEKETDENSVIADPVVVHVDDDGNTETMELVAPDEIEPAKGKTEEELLKELEEKEKEAEEAENKEAAEDEKEDKEEETEENRLTEENNTVDLEETKEKTTEDIEENTAAEEKDSEENEAAEEKNAADAPEIEETENNEETESAAESATVFFETDSFSVYAIVYTVDFYWEVDGRLYEFSLPGGGFISFSDLIEVLGIAKSGENNVDPAGEAGKESIKDSILDDVVVSEKTREFIADVEGVVFSSPEYVWVGKAKESTTVGRLKGENELEVQYSAELADEQIAEINAQTVQAGDWALISILPFTSEENLTVTMKNGEQFIIRVTDGQIKKTVIDARGDIWEITVTYGEDARIPEGSVLEARLLSEDEEEYLRAKESVQEAGHIFASIPENESLDAETAKQNADENAEGSLPASTVSMMAFDISIVSPEGNIVEPKAEVSVSITLLSLPDGADLALVGQTLEVFHIVKTEDKETAVLVADAGDSSEGTVAVGEEKAVAEFVTESFSVYTIRWGNGTNQAVRLHFVDEAGNELTGDAGVVSYKGTPLEGNTLEIDPSNPASALQFFENDILDLTDFTVPGKTLSSTHRGTPKNLIPSVEKPSYAPSQNLAQPHSVIGNELKWDRSNNCIQYKCFFTNYDKAGSCWMRAGSLPTQSDYDEANSNTRPNSTPMADAIAYPSPYTAYDYFLVYSDLPSGNSGSGGSGSGSGSGGQQGTAPTIGEVGKDKQLNPNGDGTYTLDLSVTTEAKQDTKYNDINIILVLDTSSSMRRDKNNVKPDASGYDSDSRRMKLTAEAIESFVNNLKTNNTSENPDAVEMALLTFNAYAATQVSLTNQLDTITQKVWTINGNGWTDDQLAQGTNWADGLRLAANMEIDDTDPTFVLFLTDGAPSQYWEYAERTTLGTTNGNYRLLFVDGEGSYLGAREEGRALASSGREFYAVFSFGSSDDKNNDYLGDLVDYSYNASIKGTRRQYADNKDELEAYLNQLLSVMNLSIGHTGVNYHDGIALDTTSTALKVNADGNLGSITYSKTGGTSPDYTVVINTDGTIQSFKVGGAEHKNEAAIETITYTKISGTQENGGTISTSTDSKPVYQCVVADGDYAGTYNMPIATLDVNSTTKVGDLNWDLSPLGMLENGATYKISFIVWPDQSAYDYVADLNNSTKEWNEETQVAYPEGATGEDIQYYKNGVEQFPNIVYNPNTKLYEVLTNTTQEVTYYIEDQISGGDDPYSGQYVVYPDTPSPMKLTVTQTYIEKQWSADRSPTKLVQYLYEEDGTSKEFCAEFNIFQENEYLTDPNEKPYLTVSLGWDSEKEEYVWAEGSPIKTVVYAGRVYRIGTRWEDDFAIATGMMLSAGRMEALGLDKDAYPMAKYGETIYYILERGHDYHIEEKEGLGYEFDFIAPVFHPMLIDDEPMNITFDGLLDKDTEFEPGETYEIIDITPAPGGIGTMLVDNLLRGYINLKKIVVDQDGKTVLSDDSTKFEYTIHLHNDTNPGPFEGENIPWYGVNNLFYHDDDFNYYQAETGTEDHKAHDFTLTMIAEDGNPVQYLAHCTDPDGIFDEDVYGPTQITYNDGTRDITINLYGNQMDYTEDDQNNVSANLKITQNDTLSLANIPRRTEYTITEQSQDGYKFVRILKEIKNGSVVESNSTQTGSATIVGTVVPDRDNDITYTNKVFSVDINVKKVDEKGVALPGAGFTLTKAKSGDETEDTVYTKPGDDETDTGTYTFVNLKPGNYTLVETSAPTGYEPISGNVATFTVTANNEITNVVQNTNANVTYDADSFTLTVPNPPDNSKLTVRKQWLDENGEPTDYDGTLELTLKQWGPGTPETNNVTFVIQCEGNGNDSSPRIQYQGHVTELGRRTWTGSGDVSIHWSWNRYTNDREVSVRVEGGSASCSQASSTGTQGKGGRTVTVSSIAVTGERLYVYIVIPNGGYTGTNNNLIDQNPVSLGTGIVSADYAETGKTLTITLGDNDVWSRQFTLQGDSNDQTQLSADTTILPATYDGQPCYYTIEEPSVPGFKLVQDLSGDLSTPVNSGVVTAYNQKTGRGTLVLRKIVELADDSYMSLAKADGAYNFTVTGPSGPNSETKYVQIRAKTVDGVTNYSYKIADEPINYDPADSTGFKLTPDGRVGIYDLMLGSYTVTETGFILDSDECDMRLEQVAVRMPNTSNLVTSSAELEVTAESACDAEYTNLLIPKVDIPISKTWPDYSDGNDEEGQEYSWTAVFQLQSRLIDPRTGNPATPFVPVEGRQATVTSVDQEDAFADLPMYSLQDGVMYRIEYSVMEIAYELIRVGTEGADDTVIARMHDREYYPDAEPDVGDAYALHFVQDAGENGASPDDYKIIVVNRPENRVESKNIEISIHKTWPEGTDTDTLRANFILKRYVLEEYRNVELGTENWVDITLDTGNGKPQTLHVPQGWSMWIDGKLKDGADISEIEFSEGTLAIQEDRYFFMTFTADQTKTVSLVRGSDSVIGGGNGIRLSDRNNVTDYTLRKDPGFAVPFTLSNSNDWSAVFHKLSAIEEASLTDDSGSVLTRYVYSYYFEEVNCEPEDQNIYSATYTDGNGTLIGDEDHRIDFNAAVTAANRLKPGALKITKVALVEDHEPATEAEKEMVNGNYIFTVTSGEGMEPAVTKYVQITFENGVAATYKIADTKAGLESAEAVAGSSALVSGLDVGDYTVTETVERNGLQLTGIERGDGATVNVVDFDNDRLILHVTLDDKTAQQPDAQATFTNTCYQNDGPDRITLDIVKTFVGLASTADIPDDFRVTVGYHLRGSSEPLEFVLKPHQDETVPVGEGHIRITESANGYTLNWHITNLPSDAVDFKIKEVNYNNVTGYTFLTATLDGTDITDTAGNWHDMSVEAPQAILSDVTGNRRTSDSDHNLKFKLQEGDILLSKLTGNMGTMVISIESLNTLEREAIKNGEGWPAQGGFNRDKIHFFSYEEHPEGFAYGGKTISFTFENDGELEVSFAHSASAQEYVYTVTYGTEPFLNNAALSNTYRQILITLEILKVDATDLVTPLKNARFTLRKLDPEGRGYYLTGDGAVEKESGYTTETEGKTQITGIADGYYEIKETEVPAGYIIVDEGKFYIRVTNGIIRRIIKVDDDPETPDVDESKVKNWPVLTDQTGQTIQFGGTIPAVEDDPETPDVDESKEATTTCKVGNTPGAALPYTGGPGTNMIYLLGITLIGLAGAGFVMKRRRRKAV